MAIPYRGNTGLSSYFLTSSTYCKRSLFQTDRMAGLLVEVLQHYRARQKYLLHEFVIMPDHFHLLLTPTESLERAMQLIKGGFSFRAKKELEFCGEIWEHSFHDRRVRDMAEYARLREYIYLNPVRRGLVELPQEYLYSSAASLAGVDPIPQRLKPVA